MSFTNDASNIERLRRIKCFALDMDGTFYLGGQILPGALDFIDTVEKTGRDFLFVTNNSSHNGDYYVKRLEGMGLSVTKDKIYTSGLACAAYLKNTYPGKKIFLLGNEFLNAELGGEGIMIDNDNPDLVVIGFDTTLDYKKMTAVCDYVRAGLPYIATHPDFNCPVEGGGFIPDCGAIIAFIEASTGRRPDVIIGKPYEGIVDGLIERACCPRENIAMVGDRLYTDIATGVNHGLLSVLVMSGETDADMLAASEIRPDLVFDGIGGMNEYLV